MESLKKYVEEGLSTREIGKRINKSQGSVRHWLKKEGLVTSPKKIDKYPIVAGKKICSSCSSDKELDEFYYKEKGNKRLSNVCKVCSNKSTIELLISTKVKMIKYKGGKCENCNIKYENDNYCIFDFHHINPLIKDKNFRSVRGWSWERIKKEIDNCKLLCSNCHRLEHKN